MVATAPGSGLPTGNVTVSDGVSSCTGTVASGSCQLTLTTSGARKLKATYAGDGNFIGSESTEVTHQVTSDKQTPITTVASSANPSVFGQSVTFTATIGKQGGANTPTGTVTFKEGANTLGAMALDAQGKATITTTALAVGERTIKAMYSGDSNFTASEGEVKQTINKATPAITLNGTASTTNVGQAVTFMATVSSGTGTPTGSVTFKDGNTVLETKTLDAAGKAMLTSSSLAVGQHSVTAEYTGDGNFNGITSSAFTVNILQPLEITTTTLPNGILGTNYSRSFAAVGGTPPYSWAKTAGDLPDGLNLTATGMLTGTPTKTGIFSFTVQATDNAGTKVTKAFSITFENPLPAITNIIPMSKFAGDAAFTLTVNGTNFVNGAKVLWNGNERPTTFVDSTKLTATIPSSDIGSVANAVVTVLNPLPGGGLSNAAAFPILLGYEADVAPAGMVDGRVTIADWVKMGGIYIGNDTVAMCSGEFQRADCFPKETKGDGKITIGDWVQAGRYAAGLDPMVPAGGPLGCATLSSLSLDLSSFTSELARTVRVKDANFVRGQIGTLQIELDAQGDENAMAWTLNFDPKLLSFLDAKVGDGANGASLQINSTQAARGQLGLALILSPGQRLVAGNRVLLTLRFIPNGGDSDIVTNISFSDQLLAREIVDVFAAPIQQVSYVGGAITIRGRAAANVSAASYVSTELAADSIASAFGTKLATMTAVAAISPLPTTLGGTSVKVTDAQGIQRSASLFFVSPNQINYQIPEGTAEGIATVTITNGAGEVTLGLLNIGKVAPGVFSADASGKGWAAADVVYVKPDQSQVIRQVARFDAGQNQFVPIPIDLSTDTAVLVLYGTGVRHRTSLANVKVKIGGIDAAVDYADRQGQFAGLDQINVRLPRSLAGRGEVNVEVNVEGKMANLVRVYFR